MTSRERVLARERQRGLEAAQLLQSRAADLTGTELYANEDRLPDFAAAVEAKNMLDRPLGFTCISPEGRVVRLLQLYDSTVYPQPPEALPAQWGFKWSTDPGKALPFAALSTSPYNRGDCCTEGGQTWRSTMDNNVHAPSAYPQGWEAV